MKINEYGCPFCNEFNGKKSLSYFENNIGLKHGIKQRCVLETKNFACVPSIGSFVEGYLLIIPRKHFLSSLSMPYQYTEELLSVIRFIGDFYMYSYKTKYIIFEHGSSNLDNPGGMSVLHAHLHLVPYDMLLLPTINEFDFIRYGSFYELKKDYLSQSIQNPYLLLKDTDDKIYYCEAEKIPSQYFRKKICNNCGLVGMGDWKKYSFVDNIEKTIVSANRYLLQEKYNKSLGDLYGKQIII